MSKSSKPYSAHKPKPSGVWRRQGQAAPPRDPDALDPKLLVENKRGKDVEWKNRHQDEVKAPSRKRTQTSGG